MEKKNKLKIGDLEFDLNKSDHVRVLIEAAGVPQEIANRAADNYRLTQLQKELQND